MDSCFSHDSEKACFFQLNPLLVWVSIPYTDYNHNDFDYFRTVTHSAVLPWRSG